MSTIINSKRLYTSINTVSKEKEASFLIILDLADKANIPLEEVVEWLKNKYPDTISLPCPSSLSAYLQDLAAG